MSHHTRAVVLACLVLVVGATPALAQTGPDARVEAFDYSGAGGVEHGGEDAYLWQSADHQFTVNLSSNAEFEGAVCVETDAGETSEGALGCEQATVPANATESVAVAVGDWPANLTGTQVVTVEVTSDNGSTVHASDSTSVTVIRADGDLDEDGLTNEREVSLGTGLETADTDGDGLDDGVEVDTHETSPTNNDTDGDGLTDYEEVEVHQTDPTAVDTDGDGLTDADEVAGDTNPTQADSDGDGLDDGEEVNVHETNATSADTDGDGLDDGAEVNEHETNPLRPDTDGDGLNDDLEVNTYGTDPNAVDTDGDGLEDGAEVHQHGTNPNEVDSDGDGVNDGAEVSDGALAGPTGVVVLAVALALVVLAGVMVVRSRRVPAATVPRWLARRGSDDVTEASEETGGAAADQPASEVPREFLSNEEQVFHLLDEHGGQIRQAEIVEETDWSKSKVSRVLSEMEADDDIVKVDVGKGNLVTRPEDLPAEARAPFDN